MSTHDSIAKVVRLRKEKHPEDYCKNPKCLWRTKDTPFEGGYCPKHRTICSC